MNDEPQSDPDRDARLAAIPESDSSTPLMHELADEARRRARLHGQSYPAPAQIRVLTVANQKGGVGKTTSTVNLAAALAAAGLQVLVIDNDPQGNASTALGVDHRAGTPSTYEVLINDVPMHDVVQPAQAFRNLAVVPATIDLSGAEIELVSMVARENRLRNALADYVQYRAETGLPRLDYVLIDCPPSLGLLTVNAFVAAREVLIPIQCEYYALEGLGQLMNSIELIRAHLNPSLHVSTIMLTMFDARTNLTREVADEVRAHFPEQTLQTAIPRSVRISEAPGHGQTVLSYDPSSAGALSYREAARELARRDPSTTHPLVDTSGADRDAVGGAVADRTPNQAAGYTEGEA
ncbi:MAG: ParA family protein [Beutenbergiaceae bacterium]